MEQFLIPSGEGTSEYMEKKSRFLGLITPVTTEAEARARLEAVKKREYDARHNCWAYILHSGQKRYSDDGEPQGTAGQPILNVLEREGVQDVLCVVTRYFGGILLGAGGLCRAYTKAAKDALDDAGISELRTPRRITAQAYQDELNAALAACVGGWVRDALAASQALEADFLGVGQAVAVRSGRRWAAIRDDWAELWPDVPVRVTVDADVGRTYDLRDGIDTTGGGR